MHFESRRGLICKISNCCKNLYIRIVLHRLYINLQQCSYLKSVVVLIRNCQQSLLLVIVLTTVAVYNSWYLLVTVTLCKFEVQSVQLRIPRTITSYLKWHSDLR